MIIGIILALPLASAFEFDNVKDYDETTKTITITNAFGLGDDIANLTLLTPEIVKVMPGKNRKVAEFEINNFDNYEKPLKEIKFYNANKDMGKFSRNFVYKYAEVIGQETIYETVCEEKIGANLSIYNDCSEKIKDYEDIIEWREFNHLADLPKGKITIGIFTNVYREDNVEWIPTFFGVEIDEWAIWVDAFEEDLVGYWQLNESSGTNAENVHNGSLNLTVVSAGNWLDTGIIGNAYNVSGTDTINSTINTGNYDAITVNFWINGTGVVWGNGDEIINNGKVDTVGRVYAHLNANNKTTVGAQDSTSVKAAEHGPLPQGSWSMITIALNSTALEVFWNGSRDTIADMASFSFLGQNIHFFARPDGDYPGDGFVIDEIAVWNRTLAASEISNLWNNGAGITYGGVGVGVGNVTVLSESYNTTVYEATSEGFVVNILWDNNTYTNISAALHHNGTIHTTWLNDSVDGDTLWFWTNVTIGLSTGTLEFYWNFTESNATDIIYEYSDAHNQSVSTLIFSLCNSTLNVPFINFTFEEEDSSVDLKAALANFDFTYWLTANQTDNSSYSFSNTTANLNYAFCATPNTTIHNEYSLQYSASGYPQRRYAESDDLTNVMTTITLYMLNSSKGTYSVYQVQDEGGGGISGVTVVAERQISGTWTLIEQSTTDDAGAVTFWLNPDYDHRLTFTKSGYTSVQVTVRPSSSTYTVTMLRAGEIEYISSIEGVVYLYYPPSGRLTPGINYTFGFNVTAELNNLIACKMELQNATGSILGSATGCNSFGGNLSVSLNSSEAKKIFGVFYLDIGNGYFVVDADAKWWEEEMDKPERGTLMDFFLNIKNIKQFGGETDDNKREFTRIVFFFVILMLILGGISYSTGWDVMSQGGLFLAVIPIIWAVSIAGFLNLSGISPFTKIDKYFVAFIVTLLGVGWTLNDMRRKG